MIEPIKSASVLPPAVQVALWTLQEFTDAVVSGGYLRDHLAKVPPKDIDVFTPHMEAHQIASMLRAFPDARVEIFNNAIEYISSGEVVAVYQLGLVQGIPLQLIMLSGGISPRERYKTNDFGQCQCMDDGTSFEGTAQFVSDCYMQEFTLSVCEDQRQFDRSMRRWSRLSKKFPTHELVIQSRFGVFA